jgi:soluble epoxide hydrolase/lipid-phosphate phosphatase
MLGYGGTDKPNDPAAYRAKQMAAEIISILDCESIDTVLGVGHD